MSIWGKHSRKQRWNQFVSLMLTASLSVGCSGKREKKLSYIGNADLKYYEDVALKLEYPDVEAPIPEAVANSQAPRLLGDRSQDEFWDMTLAEAIHLALANNKVVRTRNDFLSTGNQLYTNADGIQSVYDPAIRESGVLFGARGVESALSAFDTTFTTNLMFNQNSSIQNNLFAAGGLPSGSVLDQNTATFAAGLQKNMAYGAQVGVSQNINYFESNQPILLIPSSYNSNLLFNYTQPLWAGAGTDFTRIAGPLNTSITGLSGVNQGVMIARLNTDMSLVDFEIQVRNSLRDLEDIYWELYLAYRSYDSQQVARESALQTWKEVKAKMDIGGKGGGAADEAQAREAYFSARSSAEDALQNLYTLEIQLRRMCGLSANDGRIIRPADEPISAEITPEWHICLAEALTRREELRRQKWNIKSYELQLSAAKNLANPQLNFVSSYQLNGFGQYLFNQNDPTLGRAGELQSMYRTQFAGGQTGWGAGFQFNMPLGLRNALAQVRNYELRVAKAREVLGQQELEVHHELAQSFQNLAWRYKTAQTNFNRRRAAVRQLEALEAEYKAGTKTLDLLLQAQTRLATAETAYYTSLVNYNKALSDLHFRKGTLLENDNVHLSEGLWTPEAYKDALRRAWARSHAMNTPAIDPVQHMPDPVDRDDADAQVPPSGATGQPDFLAPPVPGGENTMPQEAPLGPQPHQAVDGNVTNASELPATGEEQPAAYDAPATTDTPAILPAGPPADPPASTEELLPPAE